MDKEIQAAARLVFFDALTKFRRADLDGDTDRRDLFLNLTNAIEAVFPDVGLSA